MLARSEMRFAVSAIASCSEVAPNGSTSPSAPCRARVSTVNGATSCSRLSKANSAASSRPCSNQESTWWAANRAASVLDANVHAAADVEQDRHAHRRGLGAEFGDGAGLPPVEHLEIGGRQVGNRPAPPIAHGRADSDQVHARPEDPGGLREPAGLTSAAGCAATGPATSMATRDATTACMPLLVTTHVPWLVSIENIELILCCVGSGTRNLAV